MLRRAISFHVGVVLDMDITRRLVLHGVYHASLHHFSRQVPIAQVRESYLFLSLIFGKYSST